MNDQYILLESDLFQTQKQLGIYDDLLRALMSGIVGSHSKIVERK